MRNVASIRKVFAALRNRLRRRKYWEGRLLSQFIACDVRRDILVVSNARVDEGIISARVRTTNILYVHKGLAPQPEFEPERELHIDTMWEWSGRSWGGLPDGTSIANHSPGQQSD